MNLGEQPRRQFAALVEILHRVGISIPAYAQAIQRANHEGNEAVHTEPGQTLVTWASEGRDALFKRFNCLGREDGRGGVPSADRRCIPFHLGAASDGCCFHSSSAVHMSFSVHVSFTCVVQRHINAYATQRLCIAVAAAPISPVAAVYSAGARQRIRVRSVFSASSLRWTEPAERWSRTRSRSTQPSLPTLTRRTISTTACSCLCSY